jgi:hypothetical protein
MVTIPVVAVDPAAVRAAAAQLMGGGPALAEQADIVVRTWAGLGPSYQAPEAHALLAALDPVHTATQPHGERLRSAGAALDAFSYEAQAVVGQLDDLRAAAATADPLQAADLEARAGVLLAQLEEAERTCAAAIRAAVGQQEGPASELSSGLSFTALLLGDKVPGLGASYLDTPLEFAMLTHFTSGDGGEYVLSDADLAALHDDPAVRAAGDAIRSGRMDGATPVTLEGGAPGFAVGVDFKQAVPGRTSNPFDGSLGRARVFYDAAGNAVGVSDAFDFTNGGKAVDYVNLTAGLSGAKAFHTRGGIIEEHPIDKEIPVQPDALTAAWRLFLRSEIGVDPGPYTGPEF